MYDSIQRSIKKKIKIFLGESKDKTRLFSFFSREHLVIVTECVSLFFIHNRVLDIKNESTENLTERFCL